MYNTKNYTEQGGEITHIGGKLVIDEGGSVEGLPSVSSVSIPEDSTATTVAALREDFNSLLAVLRESSGEGNEEPTVEEKPPETLPAGDSGGGEAT